VPTTKNITFQQVVSALLDEARPVHPRFIYRLSDISDEDLAQLEEAWPRVSAQRRQAIMEDIEELNETNTILSFETVARMGLRDTEPGVREVAIRILWDYDSKDLLPIFLELLEGDLESSVRAAAASALGKYIYQGEIEELPEKEWHDLEERLLQVTRGKDAAVVRRHALEALGFSGREEVSALIETAYFSGNNEWLSSALFAMGRSANHDWNQLVLEMLNNETPEICFEAVRAAGELEIRAAVPSLLQYIHDEEDDIRMAALWSLSQIGGTGAQEAMEELIAESEDEEEIGLIESALENLAFTEDLELFTLLDIDEEGEGDEGYLEEDEEDEE